MGPITSSWFKRNVLLTALFFVFLAVPVFVLPREWIWPDEQHNIIGLAADWVDLPLLTCEQASVVGAKHV